MRHWKKYIILTVLLFSFSMLTGCLFRPIEELYKLPQRFPEYESLDTEVSRVREELKMLSSSNSVEHANIISGENTAIIQFHDLDGDGIRESAVTAFRVLGAEEKPIKICVFAQDENGDYTISGMVQGEGTAIVALDFVDLNGKGRNEIVVSWQVSSGVNQLGVYTLDDLQNRKEEISSNTPVWENTTLVAMELMMTGYSDYCLTDMNQNGQREIAVAKIKLDTAGTNSVVEIYGWRNGAIENQGTVSLSGGITTLRTIRANGVHNPSTGLSVPALYVTSVLADGARVTDVIAQQNGAYSNINLDPETGVSKNILWEYSGDIEPTDINKDTILELPTPRVLPNAVQDTVSNFWLMEWTQLDVNGQERSVYTTYHNSVDGWYLIIPPHWQDRLTITRNDNVSGQRAVIFSMWNGADQEPIPFLTIYKLTGNSRSTRATVSGRFILREESTVIYSAAFPSGGWDCGLTEADLINNNFNRIFDSWAG